MEGCMTKIEKAIQERWDETYRSTPEKSLPWETFEPEPELVDVINKGWVGKGSALDICSGLGTNSLYMAEMGLDVYGIDISPTAVDKATARAEQRGITCHFSVGNAFKLDFPSKSFDFILDRGCFHHIPKGYRRGYISGLHRVLSDQGKLLLLCFSDKNSWEGNTFSIEDIRDYFSSHFDIKRSRVVVHTEPEGDKIFLNSVFMVKKA